MWLLPKTKPQKKPEMDLRVKASIKSASPTFDLRATAILNSVSRVLSDKSSTSDTAVARATRLINYGGIRHLDNLSTGSKGYFWRCCTAIACDVSMAAGIQAWPHDSLFTQS